MRISVRLFARLRDIVGAGALDREVPTGTTVRLLWEGLTAEFPDVRAYTASMSSAVNAEYSRMDTELHDGDEVAFLPPVSGGNGVPARRAQRSAPPVTLD